MKYSALLVAALWACSSFALNGRNTTSIYDPYIAQTDNTAESVPTDPADGVVMDSADGPVLYNPQPDELTLEDLIEPAGGCMRDSCAVWARVIRSSQEVIVYVNGSPTYTWPISSGKPGHGTPPFAGRHPGRISTGYCSSSKYKGGDYFAGGQDLGNMPYCMQISGGYYIHGTAAVGNLGHVASHGCIRIAPENAITLNRMFRKAHSGQSYITVE